MIKPPARCSIIGLLFIFFVANTNVALAQSKWVFEQYNYIRQPESAVFVPMLHFETKKNWYAEVRYNYEDVQTFSLFGGKTLTGGSALSYSITPMAGFSVGKFTGISAAINNELEWNDFYMSAQSQYSIATKTNATDFLFNWSELGYNISAHFFSGVAMQYTLQEGKGYFEPGVVGGMSFKNFSFPFYVFSPFSSSCYFVLGLNYEYNFKKKSNK